MNYADMNIYYGTKCKLFYEAYRIPQWLVVIPQWLVVIPQREKFKALQSIIKQVLMFNHLKTRPCVNTVRM